MGLESDAIGGMEKVTVHAADRRLGKSWTGTCTNNGMEGFPALPQGCLSAGWCLFCPRHLSLVTYVHLVLLDSHFIRFRPQGMHARQPLTRAPLSLSQRLHSHSSFAFLCSTFLSDKICSTNQLAVLFSQNKFIVQIACTHAPFRKHYM
jgi:hypothetical protein